MSRNITIFAVGNGFSWEHESQNVRQCRGTVYILTGNRVRVPDSPAAVSSN